MIQKTFILSDQQGLNAGPVGLLAKAAAAVSSSVLIQSGEQKANAKSVMSIMTIEMAHGDEFTLLIEGPDQDDALVEITKIMEECGII